MKRIGGVILLLALALTSLTGCAAGGKEAKTKAALDSAMERVVNRDDGRALAGLAVEAIQDGKVVYSWAGGRRYIDNAEPKNDLPFETSTRVRIASVSKTFAAVGIMQMAEQGKLNLDADVSGYLGFALRHPEYPDTPITCRMLLSHTSGLRDGEQYSIAPSYSLSEFFVPDGAYYEDGAHFSDAGEAPGEYFCYCNLNYGVLATILESVSGERFDRYMTNHVLKPMGIGASFSLSDLSDEERDGVSEIYRKEYDENGWAVEGSGWIVQFDKRDERSGDPDAVTVANPDSEGGCSAASAADYVIGTNATIFSPQGGLRISADELAVYAQMYMNGGSINGNQILTPASVDAMFTPVWTWNGSEDDSNGDAEGGLFACYGLGIHIITNGAYNGGYGDNFLEDTSAQTLQLAGHYGDAYGEFSIFMLDREKKAGFVYVCNGTECDYYNEPSYGNYSENWIWEEEIVTALYENIFNAAK
ncbi:MAG: beta-lactamase family protein [Oscillospiraceae bacterium]|nr:beta-lactamase family protein [Oscillospiraceae bacterium]